MTDRELQASSRDLRGFEDLIASFQTTSQSLERSYMRLQERVRTLSAELAEEREQRIRLERLAAMGEMAMELAHEIRNPLGSIELFASMIDGPHAEQIIRSVRLLTHSVTNILQFGQPVRPELAEVRFDELIEGVRAFLAPMADHRGVRIATEVDAACTCSGDYELLHRMLLNLVLNALREIPKGGKVVLTAGIVDGKVRLGVRDDGPGIPPETLSRIFDPMFSTSKEGCGLGLPIVKRIVESHGGTIDVRSSQEGTRFDIRLGAPTRTLHRRERPNIRSRHIHPVDRAHRGQAGLSAVV